MQIALAVYVALLANAQARRGQDCKCCHCCAKCHCCATLQVLSLLCNILWTVLSCFLLS